MPEIRSKSHSSLRTIKNTRVCEYCAVYEHGFCKQELSYISTSKIFVFATMMMIKPLRAFLLLFVSHVANAKLLRELQPYGQCLSDCHCRPNTVAIPTCEDISSTFGFENLGECISFLHTAGDVFFGFAPVPISFNDVKELCTLCVCDGEAPSIGSICNALDDPPSDCLHQNPAGICALVDSDDPDEPPAPCQPKL